MTDSKTTEDLAPVYQRVAARWLMWDRGMSNEEAAACVEAWPDHKEASEAVDIATFIVDVMDRENQTTKLTRPVLRALVRRHNGEFHGPRVEVVSMEAEDFWRFMDEVLAQRESQRD